MLYYNTVAPHSTSNASLYDGILESESGDTDEDVDVSDGLVGANTYAEPVQSPANRIRGGDYKHICIYKFKICKYLKMNEY